MDQAIKVQTGQSEFSLGDFLEDLWRAKFVIAAIALVGGVGGSAIGLIRDKQYEASVLISPVLEDATGGKLGGLGSLAAQYGGLASLAGISLPEKGKKDESLATLQSELLTEAYLRDNNLLPVLFSDKWDAVNKRWKESDPQKVPTLWKANVFFKKNVREVTEDRKSGLVILKIRWKDPQLAAKWANDLVRNANDYLRTRAIRESDRNVKYLTEQAAKTPVVEAQKVIYSLLQDEVNKQMIANGRQEYALKVIDPAFVPERAVTLGPRMLTALGVALGVVFATVFLFGRRVLRR